MHLNGSNDVASLYYKQGRKGINQDAMLDWESSDSIPLHSSPQSYSRRSPSCLDSFSVLSCFSECYEQQMRNWKDA
ncbi:hypothetical protein HN51_050797 [Arachis hypogaea]